MCKKNKTSKNKQNLNSINKIEYIQLIINLKIIIHIAKVCEQNHQKMVFKVK